METITVCENVCRDFSWIAGISPNVVVAFIAAFSALFIATVIYPRQKAHDRQHDLLSERRRVYLEFIRFMNSYQTTIIGGNSDEATTKQYELHRVASELVMLASPAVAEPAFNYVKALQGYRQARFGDVSNLLQEGKTRSGLRLEANKHAKAMRRECLISFRMDLFSENEEAARTCVKSFMSAGDDAISSSISSPMEEDRDQASAGEN